MSKFKSAIDQSVKFIQQASLNRNIFNYLVCVIIASVLWFLNTLNQEYTTEVNYPIKYINIPEDKYPSTKLPSHLQLNIQAKGFTLIGYAIKTSFSPLILNFEGYNDLLQKKDDLYHLTIKTNDIKDKLSSQIGPDVKLTSIHPEKIDFNLSKATQKRVIITPNIDYTLKRQYILNQVKLTPDSVLVSGPANIIDTLQQVYTNSWQLKNISKSTNKELNLKPIENCHLHIEKTKATLEIEQFTEGRKEINITPKHVPDSINIRLFPNKVTITYEVGLSKYKEVTEKDFEFTVEFPKSADIPHLGIQVGKKPTFIKNLNITPQKVEYLLEKK